MAPMRKELEREQAVMTWFRPGSGPTPCAMHRTGCEARPAQAQYHALSHPVLDTTPTTFCGDAPRQLQQLSSCAVCAHPAISVRRC